VSLDDFKPTLVTHDLIQDLKWDPQLRARWQQERSAVLDGYPLTTEEREAIDAGDFRRLYDLGLHPYLGGQLARLMFGNAAGPEATASVNKLVASLTARSE